MKGKSLGAKILFMILFTLLLGAVIVLFSLNGIKEFQKREQPEIVLSVENIVAVPGETKTINAVLRYPDGRTLDGNGNLQYRSLDTEWIVFQNEKTGVFRVLDKQMASSTVEVDVVISMTENAQVTKKITIKIVKKSSSATFDYNNASGGITDENLSFAYRETVAGLPQPIRAGYTFDGWYSADGIRVKNGDVYPFEINVTLYARWIQNSDYYVEYDSNIPSNASSAIKGETQSTVHLYGVEKELELNGYLLTGWTFLGWNTEQDGSGSFYTDGEAILDILSEAADGITLYAQWEANKYTVTYHYNGATEGDGELKSTVVYDSPYTLAKPSRTGYTFGGWFDALTGGTQYTDEDGEGLVNWTELKGKNLYAGWTANEYTIIYDYDGATGGNSEPTATVVYDENYTLAAPVKDGFTFGGWYERINGGGEKYTDERGLSRAKWTETEGRTLYARWAIALNFNYEDATTNNGGSYREITAGIPIGDLPAPEKTGYNFGGWWTGAAGGGEEYIAETIGPDISVNLYAKWVMVIGFDYQGATTGNTEASRNVTYKTQIGAERNLPEPFKTGNTFGGWFTAQGGKGVQYVNGTELYADDVLTLYAMWKTTVTFNYQEGNGSKTSIEVVYNANVNVYEALPIPTRDGFEFKGWFVDLGGQGQQIKNDMLYLYNASVTVYAAWQAEITFNYQGGTGSPASKTVIFNGNVGSLPNAQRTGYYFLGWFDRIDGEGSPYNSETQFTHNGNITLYAHWKVERYTITFDSNGGSAVTPITVNYGATAALPLSSLANYNFDGWFLSEQNNNGTGTQLKSGSVPDLGSWLSSDTSSPIQITVYAKWTFISATYYGNGTAGSPYLIYTVGQLNDLAKQVNGVGYSPNNFSGKYFSLQNNILNVGAWTPIGNNNNDTYYATISEATSRRFAGIFDGNNLTIGGYYVSGVSQRDTYLGLFGYIAQGGVVMNLKVGDVSIDGRATRNFGSKGGAHHGAIAGVNSGTISGVEVLSGSTISGSATLDTHIGGIVGYMFLQGSRVVDSNNFASVTGSAGRCTSHGGIVGSVNNAVIFRCRNSGDISGTYNSALYGFTGGNNYGLGYQFYGGIAGVACAVIADCHYDGGSISVGNVLNYGSDRGSGVIVGYLHNGSDANTGASGENELLINKTAGGLVYYSAIVNCTGVVGTHVGFMQSDTSNGKQQVVRIGSSTYKSRNSGEWKTDVNASYYANYLNVGVSISSLLDNSYLIIPQSYIITDKATGDNDFGAVLSNIAAWWNNVKPVDVILCVGILAVVSGAVIILISLLKRKKNNASK